MTRLKAALLIALMLGLVPGRAAAQAPDPDNDWYIAVYPVLAWVPLGIGIDVEIPPFDGGGGGSGSILDGRFDGAFLGGVSASRGRWRFDADIIWAAVGGDRLELPQLTVDVDLIYGHGMAGFEVVPDFYISSGVRRFALKYDVRLGNQPNFSREPGVWDPLIGVGWHRLGNKIDWHASFEGGGFGVGADVDLGAAFRVDWKPARHFGLTAGYHILYFKVSDTLLNREFTVKQSLHGPVVGIGLYF